MADSWKAPSIYGAKRRKNGPTTTLPETKDESHWYIEQWYVWHIYLFINNYLSDPTID